MSKEVKSHISHHGRLMTEIHEKDKGLYPLFGMLVLYSILFIGISIWKYEHFVIDASGDQLLFEQVIYNTSHGHFFYNNFSQQNHLGDHNSPIFVVLALFAYFIPAPYVLSIFTVLSIAIAAIPIYLLSRDLLFNKIFALLLVGGFLMLPAFVGQIYSSFHEINIVLPFLTFAFYYFTKEQFFAFIVMFVMALLVKEDVALTLFMFAPYAAIKKRDKRWYMIPAILSTAWFFLSIKVIIPFYNKNKSYGVALGYFSHLGSSLSEIVINTIKTPLTILHIMFSLKKMRYLFVLLRPFGLLLPFFSVEILFAVPSILLNMLTENSRFTLFIRYIGSDDVFIPRHMSLMASVFLFISAIYSINRACTFYPKISRQLMLVCVLSIFSVSLYDARYMMNKIYYYENSELNQNDPTAKSINKILTFIPRDATVKADLYIANHLYDRKEAIYPANSHIETDYIVITRLDSANDAGINNKYDLIAYEKNIGLFKKQINQSK